MCTNRVWKFNIHQFNKLKMFRWKPFYFIIPNKVLLSKWKIVRNSLCNFCKLNEDYSHYFITCIFLKEFWTYLIPFENIYLFCIYYIIFYFHKKCTLLKCFIFIYSFYIFIGEYFININILCFLFRSFLFYYTK
jgi:hypothetical protein